MLVHVCKCKKKLVELSTNILFENQAERSPKKKNSELSRKIVITKMFLSERKA
jgi:hypothetical protein